MHTGTVVTVVFLLLAGSLSVRAAPKASKDLKGRNGGEELDVIVQFNIPPNGRLEAKVHARRGRVIRNLPAINGLACRMTAAAAADLAEDPEVRYVSPAARGVRAQLDYAAPAVNAAAAAQ